MTIFRSSSRIFLIVFLLLALASCGNSTTRPYLLGFSSAPRVTVLNTLKTDYQYEAFRIIRGFGEVAVIEAHLFGGKSEIELIN